MEKTAETATGPLAGLRVLELGQLIAGPFCAQLFGDMGADVIKVEAPGQGDPMRTWGRTGYPLLWSVCARNKRCITANMREKEGQDIVRQLVRQADFVIENFRPGTMEKWGLGYEDPYLRVRANAAVFEAPWLCVRGGGHGRRALPDGGTRPETVARRHFPR